VISLLIEGRQHLREQFIQFVLLLHAKIRQCVVVHLLQSGQPLEGRIVLAAARHFPCRPDPLGVGIHPQTDQQLRIKRWSPAFFRTALDALVEVTQIHTPDQCPDRPRRMILTDEQIDVHRTPAHLLSVYPSNQRLVACIFLAHAPSIPGLDEFSRTEFRDVFSQLRVCKGGAFDFAFPFRRVAASTHPVSFRVKVPSGARLDALKRCYAPL